MATDTTTDTADTSSAEELDRSTDASTDPDAGTPGSPAADAGTDPGADDPDTDAESGDESATFTREYVADLRREAAGHRSRANTAEERAEELAQTLWWERVAALSLLADPTDLPYDAELLDDRDGIRAAAEQLLAAKPHLRTRRILERVGQGEGHGSDSVSLTGIMRAQA